MPCTLSAVQSVLPQARLHGGGAAEFSGLTASSREASPGSLFVCLPGARADGHQFAPDAVARGASGLVVERVLPDLTVPQLVVPSSQLALAHLAALFTGRPTDRLTTVGITGTNGKSTTTFLAEAVLRAGGYDPGLIGTIEARVGSERRALPNTTPDSLTLYRLFSEMVSAGQDAVVMEVSSIGLQAGRVHDIPFDVSVFTNLTQDHLDYHSTMEAYKAAKKRLFSEHQQTGRRHEPVAVVNIDDPAGGFMLEGFLGQKLTCGVSPEAMLRASDVESREAGVFFRFTDPSGQSHPVQLRLGGLFNVANALAALGIGWGLGIEPGQAVAALESVDSVPGRFQEIRQGQSFRVVVDYAHTPDGLKNLLESARRVSDHRVLVVFGCGGDRDRGKRPQMGRLAGELADVVIVTSDNPRSEDPLAILADIEGGLVGKSYTLEPDRARAIALAIGQARPGDVVVIAGKGHENYQIVGSQVLAFDDAEVAREALRR